MRRTLETMRAITNSRSLAPEARHYLLTLATYLDNATGTACIGVPKLATKLGLSERQTRRRADAAQQAGWLDVREAAGMAGSNIYKITPPDGDVQTPGARRRAGRPRKPPVTGDSGVSDPHVVAVKISLSPMAKPPVTDDSHSPSGSPFSNSPLCESGAAPIRASANDGTASAHTREIDRAGQEVEEQRANTPNADAVLRTLQGLPALARIASPNLAAGLAELVSMERPLRAVLRALEELGAKAQDAAEARAPWRLGKLRESARSYVLAVRVRPDEFDAAKRPPTCATPLVITPPAPVGGRYVGRPGCG